MDGNIVRTLMANNIKAARKRLNITQAKLAEKIGSSTSYIGEIEINRKFPSPGNIEKLADALGLKPFQLLSDSIEKEEKQIVLPKVREELKKVIDKDIDNIISKYMQN